MRVQCSRHDIHAQHHARAPAIGWQIHDFVRALALQQNRGASVCLVGLSRYVLRLFVVAGQGPTLRRMEWKPDWEAVAPRRPTLGFRTPVPIPRGERRDIGH